MKHQLLSLWILALLALPGFATSVPFWGAPLSSPASTPPENLKPGEWIWIGDPSPTGPIAVIVSLSEQRSYAYRNGLLIGVTTVSTGKPGYQTPVGVFTILQKDKDHRSSIYNNAPMPYQQRLTWGGVALHAGGLPGYPESHGCVHLPTAFARLLFEASHMGMTVVVSEHGKSPEDVVHPHAFMPIDAITGQEDVQPRLRNEEAFRWQPELSPEGPISILLSGADARILVFRNGIEIGRSRLKIRDPERPLGTHVYVIKEGYEPGRNPFVPGAPIPRWIALDIPGNSAEAGRPLDVAAMSRVVLPKGFSVLVFPLLQPGVTLMVTDAAVLPETTGRVQQILDAEPPPGHKTVN